MEIRASQDAERLAKLGARLVKSLAAYDVELAAYAATDDDRDVRKAAMLMLRHEEAYLAELYRQGISPQWETRRMGDAAERAVE